MGAVLACGKGAVISHESAAALLGMREGGLEPIHVSVPGERSRIPGVRCHRREPMPPTTVLDGIPLTDPRWTIVDLAAHLTLEDLTRATNEADRMGLVAHDELGALVESLPGRRGIRKLRVLLGSGWFGTDSNLERRFLRLVADAGLPVPQTQVWLEGFRVDFFWPEFKLVVETDGLTYHRTPAEQAVDRRRDQVLTAAGYTCLRFTNAQVRLEAGAVRRTLMQVVSRATRGRRPRR